MTEKKINVEVVYASPQTQKLIQLEVRGGCTIQEAIILSGITQIFPEINLDQITVGIFSKIKYLTDAVQPHDRIEIYRPLTIDPKDARRKRALRALIYSWRG